MPVERQPITLTNHFIPLRRCTLFPIPSPTPAHTMIVDFDFQKKTPGSQVGSPVAEGNRKEGGGRKMRDLHKDT